MYLKYIICNLYFAAFELYFVFHVFQLHFHCNLYLKYSFGRTGFYTDRFRFPSV